jgi:hypothetical protein
LKKLKALDTKSVFVMSLILGAVAGVVTGVFFFFIDLYDHRASEGLLMLVLAPFVYGILGAVVNWFMAWVYNKVAKKYGGIGIDLE